MALPQKFKEYLESEGVEYQLLEHDLVFTATEVAGAQHVPGRQMVKCVIIKVDSSFIMCLLPAIHYVDLEKLRQILAANDLRLAHEEEMSKLFPDCEVGAEPPFGLLYGMKVYADWFLEEDNEVAFNAGTHTSIIKMRFKDLQRLVNPIFADIGIHI